MDEMTLALLGSLVEIRTVLGPEVYESAVERARLAIAAEVMVEAERRAIRRRRLPEVGGPDRGLVIAFPGTAGRCAE